MTCVSESRLTNGCDVLIVFIYRQQLKCYIWRLVKIVKRWINPRDNRRSRCVQLRNQQKKRKIVQTFMEDLWPLHSLQNVVCFKRSKCDVIFGIQGSFSKANLSECDRWKEHKKTRWLIQEIVTDVRCICPRKYVYTCSRLWNIESEKNRNKANSQQEVFD